jgi:hypothetical protein
VRICLVSETSIRRDRRAIAEAESLRLGGHQVHGVSRDAEDEDWVDRPGKPGLLGLVTGKRATPALAEVAAGLECDIYQPVHPTAVDAAETAAQATPGSTVLVKPGWPRPAESDLISRAPSDPARSVPSSGNQPILHVPSDRHPGRQDGASGEIVIAYRRTATNPGRYLEAALNRSGLTVRRVEEIDWDTIDPRTRGVVIVESPLPALRMRATNPGVPVVFWVHHGEHHADANTRLQRRYGAHAVLLAHSWHLTHRFVGLVDRLPFAVAPELFDEDFEPHHRRRWDVGFIGARDTARYRHRQEVIDGLRDALGYERVNVSSDVTPEEMASIYRDSRLVTDDGAGRHYPITMRVFEATGAGAALLSRPGPGMELLFEPETEFVTMSEDPVGQALQFLRDGSEVVGHSGHRRAWSDHTYDIRVSELLTTLDRVRTSDMLLPDATPPAQGLAAVVDRFCDAQRVLDLGGDVGSDLPGREVWSYLDAEEKAEPGSFHLAVVVGGDATQRLRAVKAARFAVVGRKSEADRLAVTVGEAHSSFERHDFTEGTAFSFGSSGYRWSNHPDPD